MTTSPPSISAQTLALGSIVSDLLNKVSGSGTALKCYVASTGGSALASTTPISSAVQYFISQTFGGIESTRTSVSVTTSYVALPTISTQALVTGKLVSDLITALTAISSGTNLKCYASATSYPSLDTSTALSSATYYITQTVSSVESLRAAVVVTVTATGATTSAPIVNIADPENSIKPLVPISGVNTQFNKVLLSDVNDADALATPQLAVNVQYVKNAVANLIGASASTYDTLTAISNYLANDSNVGVALQAQISALSSNASDISSALLNKVDYYQTGTQSVASGFTVSGASGLSVSSNATVGGTLSVTGASTLAGLTATSATVNGSLNIVNGSLTAKSFVSVDPSATVDNGGLKMLNSGSLLSYLYIGAKWRIAAADSGSKLAFEYYTGSSWVDAVPFSTVLATV